MGMLRKRPGTAWGGLGSGLAAWGQVSVSEVGEATCPTPEQSSASLGNVAE